MIILAMTRYDQLSQTLLAAFMNNTPIEGGVRYHDMLKNIAFDHSFDSLKHIDRLLSAVRREMVANAQNDAEMKQADFRNFVLVVAFYVGKVATTQASGGQWHSANELQNQYPNIDQKSFFQMMALTKEHHKPLFILQNIAARLFGSPDKSFVSPVNMTAATDSVYWAVENWVKTAKTTPSTPVQPSVQSSPSMATPSQNQNTAKPSNVNPPKNTKKLHPSKKDPKITLLEEVKVDLSTLPASNDTQHGDYIKAVNAIDQIQLYIKNQAQQKDIAIHEVAMDDKLKTVQTNALKLLMQVAKAGNTNAMLRLALCFFEGIGVSMDDEKATGLVRNAADKGDTRAQKLLSKLYYQGVGVTQSIQMGEMWLDKAATGGHPEAKKIKSYMNQVQLMKDDYRIQNEKDKKFMMWLGVAAVVLIAVIWVSAKFL